MGLHDLSDATRAAISRQFYQRFSPMSSSSSSSPSAKIDIYECPARSPDRRMLPLPYMAAVMAAAASGARVQSQPYTLRRIANWYAEARDGCSWNWMGHDYRIDPTSRPSDITSAVCPGHYVVPINDLSSICGPGPRAGRVYRVTASTVLPYEIYVEGFNVGWYWCCWRLATRTEINTYLEALNPTPPAEQPEACDKPTFEVGDWVIGNLSGCLPIATPVTEVSQDSKGWWVKLKAPYDGVMWCSTFLRLATDAEVGAALLLDAQARGFKVGIYVTVVWRKSTCLIHGLGIWVPGGRIAGQADWVIEEARKGVPFAYALICLAAAGETCSVPLSMLKLAPAPKAIKRLVLRPEDLTGGAIWLRLPTHGSAFLVTEVSARCVALGREVRVRETFIGGTFLHLMNSGQEWSNDRVTWHPCYREDVIEGT